MDCPDVTLKCIKSHLYYVVFIISTCNVYFIFFYVRFYHCTAYTVYFYCMYVYNKQLSDGRTDGVVDRPR